MGTFDGLGIPLCGAYTTYLPDGTTAVRTLDAYGVFKHEVAWTTSSTQVSAIGSWASFYAAANFKNTVTGAVGQKWVSGLTASIDYNGTSDIANVHAATIGLRYNSSASNYGGSTSVLALLYEEETGATTPVDAGFAWFNLYNIDTSSGTVPSLFQMHGAAIDATGSMFETCTGTQTHGLVFYHNNTKYWILVADCTAS